MPDSTTVNQQMLFSKRVTFGAQVDMPEDTVGDVQMNAGDPIDVDKQFHRYRKTHAQSGNWTTQTVPLHYARADGTVEGFSAGSIVAMTAGTSFVEIDLRKNGSSILTAVLTLDEAMAAFVMTDAALDGADVAYVAGDFFDAVITVTVGTGALGQGLLCDLMVAEQPA